MAHYYFILTHWALPQNIEVIYSGFMGFKSFNLRQKKYGVLFGNILVYTLRMELRSHGYKLELEEHGGDTKHCPLGYMFMSHLIGYMKIIFLRLFVILFGSS